LKCLAKNETASSGKRNLESPKKLFQDSGFKTTLIIFAHQALIYHPIVTTSTKPLEFLDYDFNQINLSSKDLIEGCCATKTGGPCFFNKIYLSRQGCLEKSSTLIGTKRKFERFELKVRQAAATSCGQPTASPQGKPLEQEEAKGRWQ